MKPRFTIKICIYLSILTIFLSDWRISGYSIEDVTPKVFDSFSDILILLLGIILIFNIRYIKISAVKNFIVLNLIIFSNVLIHILLQDASNLILYFTKILLYSFISLLFYSFIRENELQKLFIKILINFSVIFSLIGILIYFLQVTSVNFDYNIFWKFLRQDSASYTFANSDIIRLRGLMNEPAHFGITSCFTLVIAYFNNVDYKINVFKNIIIILSTLLTLSFSTLPFLFLILSVKYLSKKNKKRSLRNLLITSVVILSIIFTIIILYNEIQQTIFNRFDRILSMDDGSANARLGNSWSYIDLEHVFFGYGIGNSPEVLFNNYAYILTELGIFIFIFSVIFNLYVLNKNFLYGVSLFIFMFQKGGYLAAPFWIIITVYLITSIKLLKTSYET